MCLQELKATDFEFPADAIWQAGYHAVSHGEKRWNGVAILARWAPVVTRIDLPGDSADGQSRYLEAELPLRPFLLAYGWGRPKETIETTHRMTLEELILGSMGPKRAPGQVDDGEVAEGEYAVLLIGRPQ